MSVENGLDELWVGVKCQSNSEIAGSPRNAFRCSLSLLSLGGRALNGLGGLPLTKPNQTTNANEIKTGSEPVGDKLHGQKGNNPDHRLRSRSVC